MRVAVLHVPRKPAAERVLFKRYSLDRGYHDRENKRAGIGWQKAAGEEAVACHAQSSELTASRPCAASAGVLARRSRRVCLRRVPARRYVCRQYGPRRSPRIHAQVSGVARTLEFVDYVCRFHEEGAVLPQQPSSLQFESVAATSNKIRSRCHGGERVR